MQLKYVGPKPIISYTGIEFDNNKEDKYVYLNIVIQLIKSLRNENLNGSTYKYQADTSRLNDDELFTKLKELCTNIDELINKENHFAEDEIQHNIQRADESKTLDNESKITLHSNIEMMHDYIIQRSINKAVYYCAIEKLAEIISKTHIEYIVVPMYEKFNHVLHSVQGVLVKQKIPIDTKLEVFKDDNNLYSKLQIVKLLS